MQEGVFDNPLTKILLRERNFNDDFEGDGMWLFIKRGA